MSNIDLSELSVRRAASAGVAPAKQPSKVLTRYLLPAVLLTGFVAVLGWTMRDQLLSATPVTVAPVVSLRAIAQLTGTPLFQAAGWVEPRPRFVEASALAEGVVEHLLIVEDQTVEQGETIATLIDIDARLALKTAESQLQLQRSEFQQAQAALTAAETNFSYPAALQSSLAGSEAELARLEAEVANLPFELQSAEAKLELAEQVLSGKRQAGDALSQRVIQQASSEQISAKALAEQLRARAPRLQKQFDALRNQRDAQAMLLELKTKEKQDVAEAKAVLATAEARIAQAQVAVDEAKLRLERMTIKAPISGHVLNIFVHRGSRMMGLSAASAEDSSVVATFYDPRQLQVRADVRLEDVPRVVAGQKVRIETAAASKPLEGKVLFATSTADIQKNTLQVKVAIEDPPATIKPEMLVRTTFLAPPTKQAESRVARRLYVPSTLVTSGDQGHFVWLADQAEGVARRKNVKLGAPGAGGLTEVIEGLAVGDRLIVSGREALADGDRIEIVGEDTTLGEADPISR